MAAARTSGPTQTDPDPGFPADLLLDGAIQPGRRHLRELLERQLRDAVQEGRLAPGSPVPPTRALADDLGVSRSVVAQAYASLVEDGYLEAHQGRGTRVRPRPPAVSPPREADDTHAGAFFGSDPRRPLTDARLPVRLLGGLPDVARFDRNLWLRHYRQVLGALPDSELSYPDPRGVEPLRVALAAYLGRVRGVTVTPDRVLVTGGVTGALAVLLRVLRRRGARRVAIEDPCFGPHRQAVEAAGLQPLPVRVDAAGVEVHQLERLDADAALVTPAHSYPTGATLSAARRHALGHWAAEHEALIIEDDYDSELRYDRTPISALQGVFPARTIYLGSMSKTLVPAIRLGWIAAPPELMAALAREKRLNDMGASVLDQHALASLLDSGDYTRHLRRVRPLYRRRRDAALAAIAELLPECGTHGEAAGLHLYLTLPGGVDVDALACRCFERGVLVEDATRHWAQPAQAPPAVIVGYAGHPEATLRRSLAVLAGELSAASPSNVTASPGSAGRRR